MLENLKFEVMCVDEKKDYLLEYESDLKEIFEKNIEYNQAIKQYDQPEITMALSEIRTNCIEWLDISLQDSVLIIGSDYGELTDFLARRTKRVICVETSDIKASITEQRNTDKDNVIVYISTIEQIDSKIHDESFDYIFLLGSLCKASQYFLNSKDPFTDMINFSIAHLKENGSIVIAEDNKYGVKYFDGTKKDGKQEYFSTFLEDSIAEHSFCKMELVNLLENTKMRYRFYYPYPDYKFAMSIFSDDYLPQKGQLDAYLNTWEKEKMELFNQGKALEQMAMDHMFDVFSNSFLIVINKSQDIIKQLPIYVKYSNERNISLKIKTEIYDNSETKKTVIKKASSKFSEMHLEKMLFYNKIMQDRYKEYGNINYQDCKGGREEGIKTTYIEGCSLIDLLKEWTEMGEKKKIEEVFETLNNYLMVGADSYFIKSRQFKEVFGNVELPKGLKCSASYNNIDFILPNIIVDQNEKWNIIDCEWVFDFPIPAKYILFRSIYYCFQHLGNTWDDLKRNLYYRFDIDDELYKNFVLMEKNFQKYIVGDGIPVRWLHQRGNIKIFQQPAEIYYAFEGQGWSVDRRIPLNNILGPDHKLLLFIEVNKDWSKMRIDPISKKCVIKIENIIDSNENSVEYIVNGKRIEPGSYFCNTKDPQIIIPKLNKEMKYIKMDLKVYELDE